MCFFYTWMCPFPFSFIPVRSQKDQAVFYAGQLEDALSGLGTNDTLLVWTLVSRSEVNRAKSSLSIIWNVGLFYF